MIIPDFDLYFRGTNKQFGEYLEILRSYLALNPQAKVIDIIEAR